MKNQLIFTIYAYLVCLICVVIFIINLIALVNPILNLRQPLLATNVYDLPKINGRSVSHEFRLDSEENFVADYQAERLACATASSPDKPAATVGCSGGRALPELTSEQLSKKYSETKELYIAAVNSSAWRNIISALVAKLIAIVIFVIHMIWLRREGASHPNA